MSQILYRAAPTKLFELTYDNGKGKQKLDVPHELISDESFQKYLIYLKCKDCSFECSFEGIP